MNTVPRRLPLALVLFATTSIGLAAACADDDGGFARPGFVPPSNAAGGANGAPPAGGAPGAGAEDGGIFEIPPPAPVGQPVGPGLGVPFGFGPAGGLVTNGPPGAAGLGADGRGPEQPGAGVLEFPGIPGGAGLGASGLSQPVDAGGDAEIGVVVVVDGVGL